MCFKRIIRGLPEYDSNCIIYSERFNMRTMKGKVMPWAHSAVYLDLLEAVLPRDKRLAEEWKSGPGFHGK